MSLSAPEVTRLGSDLQKASAAEPDAVLKILTQLRKDVTASEDLLRTTKIGITVNKFKTHKDPQIARAAGEVVAKWRRDVKNGAATTGKGGASGASPAAESGKSTPVGGTPVKEGGGAGSGVNGSTNGSGSFKVNVPLEKRSSVTDKIDTNRTGNQTRDSCLKLMYDGLANMSEEPPSTILPLATAIESAAYTAYAPETSDTYKQKLRSLFQNLKNKSNPELRLRIFSGEITPERFVRMTLEELKSKVLKEEEKELQKENMNNAMVPQTERSISSSLTCGKCKEKKVSYTQAQTRSADEPMTTFCVCMVCSHRWKFS